MTSPGTAKFNLSDLCSVVARDFPSITAMYLFGSRNYETGSLRSDIDVLLQTATHVRPQDMRALAERLCKALDVFVLEAGKATSAINGSSRSAANNDLLIAKLEAEKFWDKATGIVPGFRKMTHEFRESVPFRPTELPDRATETLADLRAIVAQTGLPTMPIVGMTLEEAAESILWVCGNILYGKYHNISKTLRKTDWIVSPSEERNFQDLIYLALKPWFPMIQREATEVEFFGRKKVSDFNLFDNRLIVDIKFADGVGRIAEITKDIPGLTLAYGKNPQCELIVFPVYAKHGLVSDVGGFEQSLSFSDKRYSAITRVIEY